MLIKISGRLIKSTLHSPISPIIPISWRKFNSTTYLLTSSSRQRTTSRSKRRTVLMSELPNNDNNNNNGGRPVNSHQMTEGAPNVEDIGIGNIFSTSRPKVNMKEFKNLLTNNYNSLN